MIKLQNLKKTLIKFSIIALVAVSASGAAAYGVYSWSSGLQEEVRKAQSQLSRARSDVSSRESKNKEAQEYLELYQKITGDSEQAKISQLDREKAENWLKQTALQNNIINLEGSVEPIAGISNPAFQKKTFEGITSRISLKFGAMTDEQIYLFLMEVMDRFPGYVKIDSFTIEKEGDITESTLAAASRGKFPELVSGEMTFNWIGAREVEAEENAQNNGRVR